jgi:preprotein translocase subunit SecG
MESNWAAEHLQVIRTLMERSALYRRALAPIMIFNGVIGLAAAALGWALRIGTPHAFILYWAGVSVIALTGSFLLVRRQALKESEPFWSPPTRRVTQALLPPLATGFIVTAGAFLRDGPVPGLGPPTTELWIPLSWVVLYGCAIHAAGFFMQRGMKLFGWACIVGGSALLAAELAGCTGAAHPLDRTYAVMGFFFGGLHLAYGVYLYFTEQRRNAT